jgi:hypothetical membrane protein
MMPAPRRLKTFTDRYPYLGPGIWMLAIEYFIVQVVVAAAWATPYSLRRNPISDLGNTACGVFEHRPVCSPRHTLMNVAFIVLGVVMAAGAPLIYQEFPKRRLTVIGFSCMGVAGVGTILVGAFPENVNHALHVTGAAAPFVVGNAGLVVMAYALPLPHRLRHYTLISGVIGLVGVVLLTAGAYLGLGMGGMERVTAYPQAVWLIVFGAYISRDHFRRSRAVRQRRGRSRRALSADRR